MATKDLFVTCVQESMKAAKTIIEPYQKSHAYSSIAMALATVLAASKAASTSDDLNVSVTEDKTAPKTGKDSIKETAPKSTKKAQAAEAPAETTAEAVAETTQSEGSEWTPEMLEKYASEIAEFNEFKEGFGEEAVNQCVSLFTENAHDSWEEFVIPDNIVGFLTYLKALANEAEAAK